MLDPTSASKCPTARPECNTEMHGEPWRPWRWTIVQAVCILYRATHVQRLYELLGTLGPDYLV